MTTISEPERCDVRPAGRLLSRYAALLLGSGATCIRLEKNVARMAARWGLEVSMAIMPRHIHMYVSDGGDGSETFIATIPRMAVSYDIITRLSALSWQVADSGTGPDETARQLDAIALTPPAGRIWVLTAAACANAAFCRLFGGDAAAMAVVFAATAAGFGLRQLMTEAGADIRCVFLVCAFVSSVLAAAGHLFGLGNTPDVAMATAVLYLVPGIPLLNAFSDMVDRHYICAFSRLTDAVILVACLSAGLCLGMKAMGTGMF